MPKDQIDGSTHEAAPGFPGQGGQPVRQHAPAGNAGKDACQFFRGKVFYRKGEGEFLTPVLFRNLGQTKGFAFGNRQRAAQRLAQHGADRLQP